MKWNKIQIQIREKMTINTNQRDRTYQRFGYCRRCNKQIPRNKKMKCKQCINEIIGNMRQGYNNNDGDNKIEVLREQLGGKIRYNNQIKKRNRDLKNKGFIDSQKQDDCMRVLALNL